jgi:NAD(P)-dependent dehydrogenase (short-subunit alcohol dehydrogenase family)
MLSLKDKVALVIGLGQTGTDGWGIGAACAVQLARQGAIVFGGNKTIESTIKTRQAIIEAGSEYYGDAIYTSYGRKISTTWRWRLRRISQHEGSASSHGGCVGFGQCRDISSVRRSAVYYQTENCSVWRRR